MDFVMQLPTTHQGYDVTLIIVDCLTKRAHFIPTHTSVTAPEVAKLFFVNIFRLHGLPRMIISDRDSKFTSHFWKALFQQIGTKLAMSTAFHPQTDGQTERMNRTLEEIFQIYSTYNQDCWDEHLAAAEFAYNNSVQASSGHTPFELDCGQHPLTPSTLATDNKVPAAENFVNHWNNMIKNAKDLLMKAQNRQVKYANEHRRHLEFKVEDQVFVIDT